MVQGEGFEPPNAGFTVRSVKPLRHPWKRKRHPLLINKKDVFDMVPPKFKFVSLQIP